MMITPKIFKLIQRIQNVQGAFYRCVAMQQKILYICFIYIFSDSSVIFHRRRLSLLGVVLQLLSVQIHLKLSVLMRTLVAPTKQK